MAAPRPPPHKRSMPPSNGSMKKARTSTLRSYTKDHHGGKDSGHLSSSEAKQAADALDEHTSSEAKLKYAGTRDKQQHLKLEVIPTSAHDTSPAVGGDTLGHDNNPHSPGLKQEVADESAAGRESGSGYDDDGALSDTRTSDEEAAETVKLNAKQEQHSRGPPRKKRRLVENHANNLPAIDHQNSSAAETASSVSLTGSKSSSRKLCIKAKPEATSEAVASQLDGPSSRSLKSSSSPSCPSQTSPRARHSRPVLPNSSLFTHMPPGLPKVPPITILGSWFHGQLVWWNRFLANRKRTQGTSIGNFVGRVVDLDSEWFPSVSDLPQIKTRLRNMAAAMGRRSMVVQGFDEMRYLTLPPRAVSVFPDPDPVRQGELLAGLNRAGSLAARRGLRLALMVEELRRDTGNHYKPQLHGLLGETNGLLEIEFLDLCFQAQESQQTASTELELAHLQQTSVWDVLRHHSFKVETGGSRTVQSFQKGDMLYEPLRQGTTQTSSTCEGGDIPIATGGRRDSTTVNSRNRVGSGDRRPDPSTRRGRSRGPQVEQQPRRSRRPAASATAAAPEEQLRRKDVETGTSVAPSRRLEPVVSSAQQTMNHCMYLCKNLCLRRSELLFLLRGVPVTLLASSTGLCLPEELPSYTLKTLEAFHTLSRSSSRQGENPSSTCRLMGLHFTIANLFLHKIFRTIAFRIAVNPRKRHQVTAASTALQSHAAFNNAQPSEPSNLSPPQQTEISTADGGAHHHAPSFLPSVTYRVVFSVDHLHQDPAALLKVRPGNVSLPDMSWIYDIPKPFPCVSYPRILWKQPLCSKLTNSTISAVDLEKKNSINMPDRRPPPQSVVSPPPVPLTPVAAAEGGQLHRINGISLVPQVKCRRASLRILGYGAMDDATAVHFDYFCVKLFRISDYAPTDEETETAAKAIVNMSPGSPTLRDLERRLEDLNLLKEIAAYLKSIYDDIAATLKQTNGELTAEDGRYFESLWLDLQRKLK